MGSLTVNVRDSNKKPLRGKKVFCNFPGSFLGMVGTHSEAYTDSDGTAEFSDVPGCTVEVYVNGKRQLNIGVGSSDHKDVTVTL